VKQTPAQALKAIGAVTLGLDLTMRDLQNDLKTKGHPWERAKAFDGACVLADWVDLSEIVDWQETKFTFHINDELRQDGNTELLMFTIGDLLTDINQVFSLEPGDVIMTGSPAGVGPLHSGDQLKMTLKGATQDFVWETFVKE
jgi:2-keto-4-pentenoate hydratase/2-oxohepta-3-ene-1,7-dioic acid hydratase in catechol pathway